MQSIICFLRLKVQDNFCISIIITWLFWGEKQTPLNEKLSFVAKVYSAVEILTTVEILHSSSHHLSNVRQQEPLSTAGSAVWFYAANFDGLYSYMDSNQGAVSLTSYLLRWVLAPVFRHRSYHFALVFHGIWTVLANLYISPYSHQKRTICTDGGTNASPSRAMLAPCGLCPSDKRGPFLLPAWQHGMAGPVAGAEQTVPLFPWFSSTYLSTQSPNNTGGSSECGARSCLLWQRVVTKNVFKKKIKHRKHLCLSSVQVYFSNTSHTTNSLVWLLHQNRIKEK